MLCSLFFSPAYGRASFACLGPLGTSHTAASQWSHSRSHCYPPRMLQQRTSGPLQGCLPLSSSSFQWCLQGQPLEIQGRRAQKDVNRLSCSRQKQQASSMFMAPSDHMNLKKAKHEQHVGNYNLQVWDTSANNGKCLQIQNLLFLALKLDPAFAWETRFSKINIIMIFWRNCIETSLSCNVGGCLLIN